MVKKKIKMSLLSKRFFLEAQGSNRKIYVFLFSKNRSGEASICSSQEVPASAGFAKCSLTCSRLGVASSGWGQVRALTRTGTLVSRKIRPRESKPRDRRSDRDREDSRFPVAAPSPGQGPRDGILPGKVWQLSLSLLPPDRKPIVSRQSAESPGRGLSPGLGSSWPT